MSLGAPSTPPPLSGVAALMAATFPGPFCYSAIGVAVPSLAAEFALSPGDVQWAASAFIAAMMGGMLMANAVLARHGLRRSLAIAAVGFSVATTLAAAAPAFAVLVPLQFAMGAFAGLMQPIAMVTLYRAYPDALRGRATSVYGVSISLVSTLAPTLAGLAIDLASWRALFVVPLPLALAGLLAARRARDDGVRTRERSDAAGLALLWTALLALLALDVRASLRGWALPLAVALGCGAAFVLRLPRVARPLIDPALFRHAGFAAAALVAMLYGALMFGLVYLVPVYVQVALGASASVAGAVQLPAGVALGVAVFVAGRAIDRWSHRPVLVTGFVVLAVTCALLGTPAAASAIALVALWSAIGRAGIGFVFGGLNAGATRVVPDPALAQVPGLVNFFRMLGGALGVKALSLIVDLGLGAAPQDAATRAAAFAPAFLLLALVAACAVPLALRMRARPVDDGRGRTPGDPVSRTPGDP